MTQARVFKPLPPIPPPPPKPDEWNTLSVLDLSEELPPIPWVCEPLGLAPGAVSLVAGYGYSRKTMALQSLGLSVASGKPVWGLWSARQGPFVHLDYEQGRRLTQERYQRLARGMGFELRDLPVGSMRACIMPQRYLHEDVSDDLTRMLEGSAFVLVDSLRAAFPKADENSSEIRSHLDVLSRVSERTGAAIAVIHHARKPSSQDQGTATHAIRGSSALFDACQSVYVFEGAKDTPTTVHHQKDRVRGLTLEDFGLVSEDLQGPAGGNRWGLAVRHLDAEQMVEGARSRSFAADESRRTNAEARIIEAIRDIQPGVPVTRALIRGLCSMRTDLFASAWHSLQASGRIRNEGTNRTPIWKMNT